MRFLARLTSVLAGLLTTVLVVSVMGLAAPAAAAAGELTFVGSNQVSGNRIAHTVRIPANVEAGDTLLLFATTNSVRTTIADPAGWTLLESQDGNGVRGRAYTRRAQPGDSGAPVVVMTSATTKAVLSLSAYRSSAEASGVSASASLLSNSFSPTLTTPPTSVVDENSWLVNFWGEKSSTVSTYTLPADVTGRGTVSASGSGKVSGALGDSNGVVPVGLVAGKTASISSGTSRGVTFSVVLSPGDVPGNRAPDASFTVACAHLTCAFDASGSADPDGDELTYSWTWGDETPGGTGAAPVHEYASPATRTVTLTVSDGELSDVATRSVATVAPPGDDVGELTHVGTATSAGNRANHTVAIPAGVRANDMLVLFVTTNTTNTSIEDPAGWTLLESVDGSGIRGRAYARTATDSDSGASVTVGTSGYSKGAVSLSAYRSSVEAPTVTASAGAVANSSTPSLTTPAVEISEHNSWLVTYWGEKSTSAVTFTLPDDAVQRGSAAAAGSGKVSEVVADSGEPVAVGTALGRRAGVNPLVGRGVMFAVAVSPGSAAGNRAPEASFTVDCVDLRCQFDASSASDPDGDPLTYAWSWGDGTPAGSGAVTEHQYATAGSRVVTLTVNDGELSDVTTQDAVTTTPPGEDIGVVTHVGTDTTAGNRVNHRATIPSGVNVGDILVMFLVTNSTNSQVNEPSGWNLLESRDGNGIRGRAWTRMAGPGDAGAGVLVTTTAAAKSVLTVSAYRSSANNGRVTASSSSLGNSSDATLTAASVPVVEQRSWLVNFWGEKSSSPTTFTVPGSVTVRGDATGAGSGKTHAAVGDSGEAVAVGSQAGRTVAVSPSVSRHVTFSVVVSPGVVTGNRAPTAAFEMQCVTLTCTVDASGSFDLDGDDLTYDWEWGDGTLADSGAAAEHKYETTGERTVTLTVSDGTTTSSSSQISVTTAPQPGPGHTAIVPETPRTNTPLISQGEIWDIEVIGNRAFVVGGFSSARNVGGSTTTYQQRQILAFDLDTGRIDAAFRPTVDGYLDAVEASPDGSKLFIAGRFSSVNGMARQNVAEIDPDSGATIGAFSAQVDGRIKELAVSDSTVYLGGVFTRVNGAVRRTLGAVNSTNGALVTSFVNDISGGVGVSGGLGVQRLVLSHDLRTLVVVHTGRQVNGQDRYGVALISAVTNRLLPWSTRLWQDNLQFVGGIQRAYTADIGIDDSYFVVASGSGGDRPPINDTIVKFPMAGGANTEPLWVSRQFDSIYSLATTEQGIYAGGHFAWNESPTSRDPWPGLDDVGYGTGQGLSGYGLGDEVVRRDHLGMIDIETGKALEWNPGSNSNEGDKAMLATERGLLVGGDGQTKGGYNVGRIAFFDFESLPAPNGTETGIIEPIEGRVERPGEEFLVAGTASALSGVDRVELTVYDRNRNRYLADDLVTWQTGSNTLATTLDQPDAGSTRWSLPLTISQNNGSLELRARAFGNNGSSDATPDTKKIETFDLSDLPPDTSIRGPGGIVASTTFTIEGEADDDTGVRGISLTLQDESSGRYLQDDGSVSATYHSFGVEPDLPGALETSWSFQVTVPYEGEWTARARATDIGGQSALDTSDRTWLVDLNAVAPTVTISSPVVMIPPTAASAVSLAPGSPVTFAGTAADDEELARVEITLRNNTTGERLGADGSWGLNGGFGSYRVSPQNIAGDTYAWSYTTPFNLSPGSYSFTVRAVDELGIATSGSNQGRLTVNVTIPGDNPPDARLDTTGTVNGGQVLHLDLSGLATDDFGVESVLVSVEENDSGRYVQLNGSLAAEFAGHPAVLATPGDTSTTWTLSLDLPTEGDYRVTAIAWDSSGQRDTSTSGATARYPIYPGDQAPTVTQSLMEPRSDAVFDDGKIVISGRVEDDRQIAQAQVAVVNAEGRYMSSSGSFTSSNPSYRNAFLNSPGSLGSNYSYTTPVIPPGVYRVLVRGVDHHGFATDPPAESTNITVNTPASDPPVASFSVSCAENICLFDGRASTDENTASLSYEWDFGDGDDDDGALLDKTYTRPGTFTVTLTVEDEFGLTGTTSQDLTIVEPPGNRAPVPVINQPNCVDLRCNISGVGSADPDPGDRFTYLWDFGDATSTSTSSAPSHTFPAAGTYTLTLTVTDGWGKAATTTRELAVTAPPEPLPAGVV